MLDLLACLRRAGLLDEHGGLILPADEKGERAFVLSSNGFLRLTQADVRQMQLAKGAVCAGVRILCRHAGITPAEIARVRLAGGFGSSLSPDSAATAGLIPGELTGRVRAEGNTALAGALMSARDPGLLDECDRIRSEVRVVDLAGDAEFQDAFVEAMGFPPLPEKD